MAKIPAKLLDFVPVAMHNATRAALAAAEFLPIVEAVQLVLRGNNDLVGVRVFLEPPVKAVFCPPAGAPVLEAYGEQRKSQAPLDCDYYIFIVKDGVLDMS